MFLPACDPTTSCQKKHIRKTYTHILVVLRGSHYLRSADSLRPWMYVFLCVFATGAMLHLCTRPVEPSTPLSLSRASGKPELSIKLASYREQWSCGVCLGQCVHINLSSKRPTPTAMLRSYDAPLPDKSFLGKKWLLVTFHCRSETVLIGCLRHQIINIR